MNSTTAPTNTSSEDNGSGYHFTIISLLIVLIFITLSIATVAGNGIFLLTFYKDPLKCLRTPSAILIAGLTSANFLIGLIVEPAFVIIYVLAFVYVDGADFDKFYRFAEVFTFITMNSSFLIMLALGVVQYLLIQHPSVYQKLVTPKSSVIGLIFIFVYSVFFSLLPEMTGINKALFTFVDLVVHNTLLTVVIVVLYMMVYFAFRTVAQQLRDTNQEESSNGQRPECERERQRAEKDFVYGTIILTVVLIIAAWPLTITVFIAIFHVLSLRVWIAYMVTLLFLLLKFAVDPFLFTRRITKYRKSVVLVMRRVCSSSEPEAPRAIYRRESPRIGDTPSDSEEMQVTVIHGDNPMTQEHTAVA